MATKMRIRVGNVEVEYEGPDSFLTKKLPDLIVRLSKIDVEPSKDNGGEPRGRRPGTLAAFIKSKNAFNPQTKRFLATAQWLHLQGKKSLRTTDVTGALKKHQQGRLTNASDCLNKNVNKGFCEKDGSDFDVTDDGRNELG